MENPHCGICGATAAAKLGADHDAFLAAARAERLGALAALAGGR
jgi:hypothetical protein